MSSGKLLSWFEKRRRTKTLSLVQEHIQLVVDTVRELEALLNAFAEGDLAKVDSSTDRLFKEEVEVDSLRRTIMEELSKGELPADFREDLKGLVSRLDELADKVKDSARGARVLLNVPFPREIMDVFVRIGKNLADSVQYLRVSIESLGVGPAEVRAATDKVDILEATIDEEYLNGKTLIIRHGEGLDAAVVVALRDLVEFLEQASDAILRTSDFVRILAARRTD
ncbi:MAG: DUF47 family protein [Candidatus Bathyarchaeia archaeon]